MKQTKMVVAQGKHSLTAPTKKFPPESTKRSTRISSLIMCPISGNLKSRLDMSLPHLPIPVSGKKFQPICQLHCWDHWKKNGEQINSTPSGSQSNAMACETCHVNLCLQ
mmetsp:Transcript_16013/g.33844  ORF Transcript_16013/g.33844 Transcript_16013/m.33844 type:complete len:109 (-) Transcript_16013:81-407(-)